MANERLVIGSKNIAKVNEWREIFQELGIKIDDLNSFSYIPDPSEDADTFIGNASIKASEYAKFINQLVMADDGGYEIDFFEGWPGVKSRRILEGDKEGTDQQLIDTVLTKMKDLPLEERTASFTSAVALSDPQGNIIFKDVASSNGWVAEKVGPVLVNGYPYRSIHWLPELGKTYAELTKEEHKKYSHKRPIAEKLARFLKNLETY